MKNRNIESIPAVKTLIDLLNKNKYRDIDPNLKAAIENVLDGAERLDTEVKLKTVEVQNKNNLLIQKEQVIVQKEQQELIKTLPKLYPSYYPTDVKKWPDDWGRTVIENNNFEEIKKHLPDFKQQLLKKELIETLPKLYPNFYFADFNKWPNDWGRTVIENNNFEEIKKHLPDFKQQLLKKEFIDTLHKLYPNDYPADFNKWPNNWGRTVINSNNSKAIKHWLNIYKKQLVENLNQSVLTKEKELCELRDNEVKKSSDKELEIARLKERLASKQVELTQKEKELKKQLSINEKELANKEQLLSDQIKQIDNLKQVTLKEFEDRERDKDKALVEKENEITKLAQENKLLLERYERELIKSQELLRIQEEEIKEKNNLLLTKGLKKEAEKEQGEIGLKGHKIVDLESTVLGNVLDKKLVSTSNTLALNNSNPISQSREEVQPLKAVNKAVYGHDNQTSGSSEVPSQCEYILLGAITDIFSWE